MSPSTDEDEGPLATLPDEDAFAAEAPASQDPGQKQKAKQPKKRKAEAAAIAADSGIQMVGNSTCLCTLLRCVCIQVVLLLHAYQHAEEW